MATWFAVLTYIPSISASNYWQNFSESVSRLGKRQGTRHIMGIPFAVLLVMLRCFGTNWRLILHALQIVRIGSPSCPEG